MARAAVALVLLGLATAFAQTYVLDTQQQQKSVQYNVTFNGYQGPAEEIPAGDPLVAPPPKLGPYTPWSVHVQLGEGSKTGSVWISWSTGIPALVTNPAQLPQPANKYADDYPQPPPAKYQFEPRTQDPAAVASQVNWGPFPGKYLTTAVGTARSYIQTYYFSGPTFESQLFHHVHVTGIPYGKKIYYQCALAPRSGVPSMLVPGQLHVAATPKH